MTLKNNLRIFSPRAATLLAGLTVWIVQSAFAGTTGQLTSWGDNYYGQCNTPPGNGFAAIATGLRHGLALKSDGSLAAWGQNGDGQCDIPAGNNFRTIAAGYFYSVALKTDGSLVAWGDNKSGQCNVPAGNNFIAIAAGANHNLALRSDGSLAAWGANGEGECNVPSGKDFIAVSGGALHSLALRSGGSLIAWGDNSAGQCDIPAGNNFVAIAAGFGHNLALRSDGSIVAWGDNSAGQCNIPADSNFRAVAAGYMHSVGMKSDGSLVAWGDNQFGQQKVPAGSSFVVIATSEASDYSLAIKTCQYALAGDINGDCRTDLEDLVLFAGEWLNNCNGPTWCNNSDINHSGMVNLRGFGRMAANWLVDCDAAPGNPACIPNTTVCQYALAGDINGDCRVDLEDIDLFSDEWLNSCSSPTWCNNSDIDHNGKTNLRDFARIMANWLINCDATPENAACVSH